MGSCAFFLLADKQPTPTTLKCKQSKIKLTSLKASSPTTLRNKGRRTTLAQRILVKQRKKQKRQNKIKNRKQAAYRSHVTAM